MSAGAPARVLCLNAGSSSLKFALFEFDGGREHTRLEGSADRIGLAGGKLALRGEALGKPVEQARDFRDHAAAVHAALDALDGQHLAAPDAVGHRVVHGGPDHREPTRADASLLAALRAAVPFAPLHLPSEIAAIEAVAARAPETPQVVCFDTAFHRTLPDVAKHFPLPREFARRGVVRYGFHGLSYEYVVETMGAQNLGRAVIAHLGNGASLAAVRDGISVDTTMGFTPAGGVVMGTRTGDLDPGLLTYLLTHAGYDAASLEKLVTREAGLLGVSGSSPDMRTLLARRETDPDAALAVQMFCDRVRKAIGAFGTVLGGIDTLVFTGGIGENAAEVREEILRGTEFLGIRAVRVVPTNEALMIARHVRRTLANRG